MPNEQGGSGWDRRKFLRTAAMVGAGTVATGVVVEGISLLDKTTKHGKEKHKTKEHKPIVYETGKLAGTKFSDLYTQYTGIEGVVPPRVAIDFDQRLIDLWSKKSQRSGANEVVDTVGSQLVSEYQENDRQVMTLDSYLKEVSSAVTDIHDNINWEQVGRIKNLQADELAVVKKIAQAIDQKDLVAYSLTELMPSADGKVNVETLKFLLRTAGKRYVESIPALFDPKTSFGPYQFTEYALYDTGSEKRGASIINQALPKDKKVPGSVAKLRGNDHHRAAYLFMIDNFCALVKRAKRFEGKKSAPKKGKPKVQPFSMLTAHWREQKDQLVVYAATAHHMPAYAVDASMRWLSSDLKHNFEYSCHSHLKKYSEKTAANMRGLENI